jgi:hypothetical protein
MIPEGQFSNSSQAGNFIFEAPIVHNDATERPVVYNFLTEPGPIFITRTVWTRGYFIHE